MAVWAGAEGTRSQVSAQRPGVATGAMPGPGPRGRPPWCRRGRGTRRGPAGAGPPDGCVAGTGTRPPVWKELRACGGRVARAGPGTSWAMARRGPGSLVGRGEMVV